MQPEPVSLLDRTRSRTDVLEPDVLDTGVAHLIVNPESMSTVMSSRVSVKMNSITWPLPPPQAAGPCGAQ
jgi:hypothetical protein